MKKQTLALVMAAFALIWIAGCSSDSNPSSPDGNRSQFRPQAPVPPALGDRVWHDLNMDGIQGDTLEEQGLPNIPIYLYTCTDSLIDSTKTDTMGYYFFDELMPGGYYVKFMLPDGYAFSPKDQGENDSADSDVGRGWRTDCITLDSNEVDLTWDAGMYITDPGCTRSKGYWKNHAGFGPQADVVTELLPIWLGTDSGGASIAVVDAQTAYDILGQDVYGHPSNGITKLYAQLLAAKLNIADGASSVDVKRALKAADGFLADYDWNDWDTLDRDAKKMVLTLQGIFDSYNNGYIGPGYCGDDMDDDHNGDDDDHDGQDDPDDAPSMR